MLDASEQRMVDLKSECAMMVDGYKLPVDHLHCDAPPMLMGCVLTIPPTGMGGITYGAAVVGIVKLIRPLLLVSS